MNRKKFFESMNGDLLASKTNLKDKSKEILEEINQYKSFMNFEEEKEELSSIFFNVDENVNFKFTQIDDEDKDIINNVLLKDPLFALGFLERHSSEFEKDTYDSLKDSIIEKLNLK